MILTTLNPWFRGVCNIFFLSLCSNQNQSLILQNARRKGEEKKRDIANGLLKGTMGECKRKRKLFTTAGGCLVHVKLWPARYCLWCLSFNRLVDIMNEPDPPSATGERSPALSELRSTLEPLGQSGHRVPAAAKCRPQGTKEEQETFVLLRV